MPSCLTLLFPAWFVCAWIVSLASLGAEDPSGISLEVSRRLEAQGRTVVCVELVDPSLKEDSLQVRCRKYARSQELLLKTLLAGDCHLRYRYRYSPVVVLELTQPSALLRLKKAAGVKKVELDLEGRGGLLQSLQLTRANSVHQAGVEGGGTVAVVLDTGIDADNDNFEGAGKATRLVYRQHLDDNAYSDPDMWYSRPGIGTNDPSRYQPAIAETENPLPRSEEEGTLVEQASKAETRRVTADEAEDAPPFAVFFVHPTSYIPTNMDKDIQWNARLGDKETEDRATLFLRGLASPFNRAAEIWSPKYRQATVGAFITDKPEAEQAIDAAYRDVEQAFDYFLESVDEDRPIVLAGHSQGSLHLLRLLRERVKGRPLENRIAAVYAIGVFFAVVHMSSDYFAHKAPAEATWRRRHPLLRLVFRGLKNVAGGGLVLLGLAMLVLPEILVAVLEGIESPVMVLAGVKVAFVAFARSELIDAVSLAAAIHVIAAKAVTIGKNERTETVPLPVLESTDVFATVWVS